MLSDSTADAFGPLPPRSLAKRELQDGYLSKLTKSTAPLFEITGIQFGLMDPNEFRRIAAEKITKSTVNNKGAPTPNSVNSASLGPSDRNSVCHSCQVAPCACDGQFGYLDFAYPIYHVAYFDRIIKILNSICPWCHRLLLNQESAAFRNVVLAEKNPKQRLLLLHQLSARIQYCDSMSSNGKKVKIPVVSDVEAEIKYWKSVVENLEGKQEVLCTRYIQYLENELDTTTSSSSKTEEIVEVVVGRKRKATAAKEEEEKKTKKKTQQLTNDKIQEFKENWKAHLVHLEQKEQERLSSIGCCGGVQFKYERKNNSIWRTAKDTDDEFVKDKKYFVTPATVLYIFEHLSDDIIKLVGNCPKYARTSWMLLTLFPINPKGNRPNSNFSYGTQKKAEHPFTKRYRDIVKFNEELRRERCRLIHWFRDQKTKQKSQQQQQPQKQAESKGKNTGREFGEADISIKSSSTLTAVLRSDHDRKRTLAKKDLEQVQVQLQEGELTIVENYKSGDPTISDQEWDDFLSLDIASYAESRQLIDMVQFLVGSYFREDTPAPKHGANQRHCSTAASKTSIRSKLKGKGGWVRANLQAKRNDHSMRGVITPNSNMDVDELGMPEDKAKEVTVPETVTNQNYHLMERLIRNGPEHYPGAKYVSEMDQEDHEWKMIDLAYLDRIDFVKNKLKIGMVVHRHILQGEYIPFNRQPSLWKFNFMAHRIRIIQGCNFEMNPAACRCYNADFDGDAMVLHIPQTYGARIESERLLKLELLFETPQSSRPLIAPIQDTVLGCFQFSQPDIILEETLFRKYIGNAMYIPLHTICSKPPAIIRADPQHPNRWKAYRTGRQYLSQLWPQDFEYFQDRKSFQKILHLSFNTVLVEGTEDKWLDDDVNTEPVVILQGDHLLGIMTANIVGTTGFGIIHQLIHRYGNNCCVRIESDLQRCVCKLLSVYGFSVGPSDFDLKNEQSITNLISQGTECIRKHPLLKINQLQLEKQTSNGILHSTDPILEKKREQTTVNILNQFTTFIGTQVEKQVKDVNRMHQMVKSKSKGKDFNITQTLGLLGQTMVGGKRLSNVGRPTSHFPLHTFDSKWSHLSQFALNDPLMAQGFITNAFARGGLSPFQFFAHSKGGREGLVSSAINTGETGYAQRRLIQAMTNLMIHFDLSVRDAAGNVLQMLYGQDGFDATYLNRIEIPFLAMSNKELMDMYSSIHLTDDLWVLEQQGATSSSSSSKFELGQLLATELNLLQLYRDKIRQARFHYDCMQLDIHASVPADVLLILSSARKGFAQKNLRINPTRVFDFSKLNPQDNSDTSRQLLYPSLVIRMTHALIEHLYSFYPTSINRLYVFEAFLLSTLCVKNVICVYQLDYASFCWVLEEIVLCFARALVDPKDVKGPETGQMVGELYTQGALDLHAKAGAAEEGGTIGIFQECINVTLKPKNPSMRIFPISLQKIQEFFSPQEIQQFVFKGKNVDQLEETTQKQMIAEYVASEMVSVYLNDVLLSLSTKQDATNKMWLEVYKAFVPSTHWLHTSHHFSFVLTIDAQKCSSLHLTCSDIISMLNLYVSQLKKPIAGHIKYLASPLLTCDSKSKEEYWQIYVGLIPKVAAAASVSATPPEAPPVTSKIGSVSKKEKACPQTQLNSLMHDMKKNIRLSGVPEISSAQVVSEVFKVVNIETGEIETDEQFVIITRGSNIAEALSHPFVDDKKSTTNYAPETSEVWGMEVGANVTGRSLDKVLMGHGDFIDRRHLGQVVKTMCHRGFFMAFRRQGFNKVNNKGVIQSCSFEETFETLCDAAACGDYDPLEGCTETSMIGKEIPAGTGAVQLILGDLQPTPEVIASHVEYIKEQVLPVFNDLDYNIMMQNSGRQQLYDSNNHAKQETWLAEDVAKWIHQQESKQYRRANITATTTNTAAPKDETKGGEIKIESSLITNNYWEKIQSQRQALENDIKTKVGLRNCLMDHVRAVTSKRKSITKAKIISTPGNKAIVVENSKKRKQTSANDDKKLSTIVFYDTIKFHSSSTKENHKKTNKKNVKNKPAADDLPLQILFI